MKIAFRFVPVLALGLLSSAAFPAYFSISISGSLVVNGGPVTNTFGYGVVTDAPSQSTGGSGNGYGTANPSAFYISSGVQASSTIFGNAAPDPSFSSTATATGGHGGHINLFNLTGNPGMEPAAYYLASLTWTYSYTVTLVTATGETASGSVGVKVGSHTEIFPFSASDGETKVESGSGGATYTINMPAGYSVSQAFRVGATGSVSAPMETVPEPASFLALSLPLGIFVRRKLSSR